MIPFDFITAWRAHAPWVDNSQVEQDRVISRALVEIFAHPALADALALRGGTALSKLHLRPAARYSEDNSATWTALSTRRGPHCDPPKRLTGLHCTWVG